MDVGNMTRYRKYKNRVIESADGRFDSEAEYRYWCHLKARLASDEISELQRHVAFELAPGVSIHGRKRPPLRYFADMAYMEDGKRIVVDVKGMITDVYRIKRHLMKAVHDIDIVEVKA